MAGTIEGGRKCAAENKRKYGEDYYQKIGAKGGSKKVPKGFAMMSRGRVSEIGKVGGKISKRGKKER